MLPWNMLPADLRQRFGVRALLEVFGFKMSMLQATVLKFEAFIQLRAPLRDVLFGVTQAARCDALCL
jgi:hypothetical protein